MAFMKATDFFKTMLSIPRSEPFTRTARFTQWSALLAYSGGGLSMLLAPNLWEAALNLDSTKRSRGYLRLVGCYLATLSFIYVVLARASSRVLGGVGPILVSVPERLLYVNGALLMMYLREMLPLGFVALFLVLESSLALLTLILWCSETTNPSPGAFFREITAPLSAQSTKRSLTVQQAFRAVVGAVQLVSGLVLMAVPSRVQMLLHLDTFVYGTFASGYLSAMFLLASIHGLYHIFTSTEEKGSVAFSSAAVFYRVVFVIPVLCVLFAVDAIEYQLALLLGSWEAASAIAILVSFLWRRNEKEASILKQESSDTDE